MPALPTPRPPLEVHRPQVTWALWPSALAVRSTGHGGRRLVFAALLGSLLWAPQGLAEGQAQRARLDADAAAGRPLVAHVVVALCDNATQSISPVPRKLGDGSDPRNNLYWGARYGVRTFLQRDAGWQKVAHRGPAPDGVLERLVMHTRLVRDGKQVDAYVVADAWEGRRIEEAISHFLEASAGAHRQTVRLEGATGEQTVLEAGGLSHLILFVGHNGLMDFPVPHTSPPPREGGPARSAAVLSCRSSPYFKGLLSRAQAHPLVLTHSLMAPEGYVVDAIVRAWFEGQGADHTRKAAAQAYHRYQKCGLRAAGRLFGVPLP
jgi:hypothetical protein